jgi:hypothetical protein
MIRRRIWVTWALPGFHRYPDAPDEVAFLRNEHRHMFQFKVTLYVAHDDRELEFFMVQRRCVEFCKDKMGLDHQSCEMMAEKVLRFVEETYCTQRNRFVEVEVSEDGECGAIVSRS